MDGDIVNVDCSWTINSGSGPVDPGVSDCTLSGGFAAGDVVECIANPHDGTTSGPNYTTDVTVVNGPPAVTGWTITPANPERGEVIECIPSVTDPDGDSANFEVTWTLGDDPYFRYTDVAVGWKHACFLSPYGTVTCDGDNSNSQTDVPPDAVDLVQISADDNSTCALDIDGGIHCWGDQASDSSYTQHPSTDGFTQVAVGPYTSCALDANGDIVCWGASSLQDPTPTNGPYTELSVGDGIACALNFAGALDCWSVQGSSPGTTATLIDLGNTDLSGTYIDVAVDYFQICVIDTVGRIDCVVDSSRPAWSSDYDDLLNYPDSSDDVYYTPRSRRPLSQPARSMKTNKFTVGGRTTRASSPKLAGNAVGTLLWVFRQAASLTCSAMSVAGDTMARTVLTRMRRHLATPK